ncbi:MAG: hypothetical protein AAF206_28320, partial [Bacteroidota bacterium]
MRPKISPSFFFLLLFSPALMWAQPNPSVSENLASENFINETYCFDAVLTLSGDPGFGPYYRIMLPPDVQLQSVSFEGTNLSATQVGAFPASPVELTDPFSDDQVAAANGAVEGDTLYVVKFPIGSVTSSTPDLVMQICVSFNDEATIDSNYTFTLEPALEFGDTPTGANGSVYGTVVTAQSKPTLVTWDKSNNAPENERPPGSSWPVTYSLNVDVSNLKTLSSPVITDVIPTDVSWVGNLTVTGGNGCSANYTPGTRTVSVSCTDVTGTTSADEIVVTYDVFVNDILDENSCADDIVTNSADFTAMFNSSTVNPDSARDTLDVKHVPIQAVASPFNVLPGDTVTVNTNFQVTDFDNTVLNPIDRYIITEVLPGGVSYDFTFTATITLSGGTSFGPATITPTVDTLSGDTVRLTFDVHGVTGDIASGTEGVIQYQAAVRQHYDFAGTDPILSRDGLSIGVTSDYDLAGKASGCSDNSSAGLFVIAPTPALSVVNGPNNGACYVPAENLTFKLSITVPSGDTEGIIFNNYFPLPVFDVSEVDTDNFGPGFDIRLAPDHSDPGFVPSTANITKNTASNSIQIVWPDLTGTTESRTLSVFVDIPIDFEPFNDGLFLSNIFQYQTTNSAGETVSEIEVEYLNICAPNIETYKGFSATNGDGVIAPFPTARPNVSDITDSDAGDQLSFELTLVNAGGAKAYDVLVQDTFASGLTACDTIALNPVRFGDGTIVPAASYTGSPFDMGGMTIDSLFENGDASSRDTVIISCTCLIDIDKEPREQFTNVIRSQWQSIPGAIEPTATQFDPILDSAFVTIADPVLVKTHTDISPNGTGNANEVTAGDTITYQVQITLPEGTTTGLVISDTLPE